MTALRILARLWRSYPAAWPIDELRRAMGVAPPGTWEHRYFEWALLICEAFGLVERIEIRGVAMVRWGQR